MELNSGYARVDEDEKAYRLNALLSSEVLYLSSEIELLDRHPDDAEILAYIIKYEPSGFVVVSGEDRIHPIFVFGVKSEFRWDQPDRNFLRYFLTTVIKKHWDNLREKTNRGIQVSIHPKWLYLRSKLTENVDIRKVAHEKLPSTILIQWDTAAWDQWSFYNDVVIAQNGNTPGIPTGCTATAMAIKMRYHEWPLTGASAHFYNDIWGAVQFFHSVNYSVQTYSWANMPTTDLTGPNQDIADLMYHCGVSVDMDYEVGISRAWPSAAAMNTYFGYKGTDELTAAHAGPIQLSVKGGLPVVISSSAHTVLVDGYRDTVSPYYHLNNGGGGAGDGWYNLDQIPGGDPTIDRSYPYSSPSNYFYVDSAWTGFEFGLIQLPYNTLVEGRDAVPTNGHLWIKSGNYVGTGNSPITFDRAMTINSYGGSAIIGQ
jgi:hypothetical protein